MTEKPLPWKTAWVTGASSGIGAEIARQLAASGVKVAVSARSRDRLEDLGAGIFPVPLDVTDPEACRAAALLIETRIGPIELAVLGAGTYEPVAIGKLDPKVFAHMMDTNYMGVVNCVAALAPAMVQRGQGHLSWIASVAGYMGLPKAAAYGPTKAALINLAESLHPELKAKGVAVSVVNPGFVATPLTDRNDFPMPFLMSPEEAARRTIEGLKAGRFEIAYPRRFVFLLKMARALPYSVFFRLMERIVLKNGSA